MTADKNGVRIGMAGEVTVQGVQKARDPIKHVCAGFPVSDAVEKGAVAATFVALPEKSFLGKKVSPLLLAQTWVFSKGDVGV